MSKHADGTVASITWNNAPMGKDAEMTTAVAVYDADDGWWAMGYGTGLDDKQIVDPRIAATIRPLVVLDPDNREQVQRILDHLAANGDWYFEDESVGEVQRALRSLVVPPRPTEPTGLDAVVEDESGELWIRRHDLDPTVPWRARGGDWFQKWDGLKVKRVLSDGAA